jgi:hypothetical protein
VASGESEGRVWIARARIEGESLSEHLARSGPLAVAEVARIGMQLAAALGELHRAGVLHRDVRPGHVVLDLSGRALLLDAGVARTFRTLDGRTAHGTPGYVPPEAIAGKLVSFRSDLYALGATLFELLTGAPPYGPPDSPGVLTLQTRTDAPPLGVPAPPAFARLIASLLSREPRERPFSAQQLERQLALFASGPASDLVSTERSAPPPRPAPVEDPEFDEGSTEVSSRPKGLAVPSAPVPAVTSGPALAPRVAGPVASAGATPVGVVASLPERAANEGPLAPVAQVVGGAPVLAPVAAKEASGSIVRPPPSHDLEQDFDEELDTVVQEDSRIFGLPEVTRGSPHGSAVPPLPEPVAARVLTGSMPPPPEPTRAATVSVLPTSPGRPLPPSPRVPTLPPPAPARAAAAPRSVPPPPPAPLPPTQPAFSTPAPLQPPQPALSTPPAPLPPTRPAFPTPSAPVPVVPQAAASVPEASARSSVLPAGAPLPPRRTLWPWLLAGIGVAGIAGASGFLVATRARIAAGSASAPPPVPVVAVVAATSPAPLPPPVVAAPAPAPLPEAPLPEPAAPVANVALPAPEPVPEAPPPEPAAPAIAPAPRRATAPRRVTRAAAVPRTDSLAQAREALARRDLATARALLLTAVRQQPSNAEAHALLGDTLARGGDQAGALEQLRQAVRLAPRSPAYLRRLAELQLAARDRSGATTTLRQLLQADARNAWARQQLDQLERASSPTGLPLARTPAGPSAAPTPPARPTPARRTRAADPVVPVFGAPVRR